MLKKSPTSKVQTIAKSIEIVKIKIKADSQHIKDLEQSYKTLGDDAKNLSQSVDKNIVSGSSTKTDSNSIDVLNGGLVKSEFGTNIDLIEKQIDKQLKNITSSHKTLVNLALTQDKYIVALDKISKAISKLEKENVNVTAEKKELQDALLVINNNKTSIITLQKSAKDVNDLLSKIEYSVAKLNFPNLLSKTSEISDKLAEKINKIAKVLSNNSDFKQNEALVIFNNSILGLEQQIQALQISALKTISVNPNGNGSTTVNSTLVGFSNFKAQQPLDIVGAGAKKDELDFGLSDSIVDIQVDSKTSDQLSISSDKNSKKLNLI